ncbi:MAG: SpoIIE family protein phosphatase [Alphaproteobacteria bacterium]|jgi:serine phosphatase RsbU (regulator of sigma subunit)|nr:SpoIIE family protein phosphatase [Alphaproteobacteria bacterium]
MSTATPRRDHRELDHATQLSHTMHCMEIWGGTAHADDRVATPGLNVWVRSEPHARSRAGGDVHYLSMCGAGQISRFLVADVAGHGQRVADLAGRLRKLMRRYINNPDASRFARSLNDQFGRTTDEGRFATAIIATFFAPTHQLVVVNAGHPRPLWYRARPAEWQVLTSTCEQRDQAGPADLPLGVVAGTDYRQYAITLEPGDLVMLFTDSLPEATAPAGRQLGEAGLVDLARRVDATDPEHVGRSLLDKVADHRGGAPADDDLTLVTIHHTGEDPPAPPLRERITAMARMLGLLPM